MGTNKKQTNKQGSSLKTAGLLVWSNKPNQNEPNPWVIFKRFLVCLVCKSIFSPLSLTACYCQSEALGNPGKNLETSGLAGKAAKRSAQRNLGDLLVLIYRNFARAAIFTSALGFVLSSCWNLFVCSQSLESSQVAATVKLFIYLMDRNSGTWGSFFKKVGTFLFPIII